MHVLPDLTDALVDKLDGARTSTFLPTTGGLYIDLDNCPKDPDYLADAGGTSPPLPPTPTVAKALQALRMFQAGSPLRHIDAPCDLDPSASNN